jgi:dATP pyrophosphohydrolase
MSARAPFQVLVISFWSDAIGTRRYCIFRRKDAGYWQGIAGGGELGENHREAAQREVLEEAGISQHAAIFQLTTISSIPVADIDGFLWGEDVPVIPEYTFGLQVPDPRVTLSKEHTEFQWLEYEHARKLLKWDSNRTALWELDYRVSKGLIGTNTARTFG